MRRRSLAEIEAQVIASCPNPKCGASVRDDHPYPWCIACGDRFPESLQRRLPKLQSREVPLPGLTVEEICPRCGTHFRASAKLDVLGFREVTCPNCSQLIAHPLKWGYRITYWVFLGLFGVSLVQAFLDGEILELGTLEAFFLIYVLLRVILKDLRILRRQRVSGGL
jgi:hypothetical protein